MFGMEMSPGFRVPTGKSLDAKKSKYLFAIGRNKVALHTETPQQDFGIHSSECFYYQLSDKEFGVCCTSVI